MLSFEEFQDYCKEHLVGALPDGYENATVTVNEVIKNNGRVLTALTVMPEGQNVAPNIYLDGFYMEYETGTDLDTIMDEMADLCMSHIHPSQDISNIGQQFRDVNFVRDRIIMVAVNREKNAELLSDCPHTNREDLALIYKVLVSSEDIEHEFLNVWFERLDNAVKEFEAVQDRFNQNMAEIYLEDLAKKKRDREFMSINSFLMTRRDYIFTGNQMKKLLMLLGLTEKAAKNKAYNFKKHHNIEYFKRDDLEYIVADIKAKMIEYFLK